MSPTIQSKIKGAILGFALGDALGEKARSLTPKETISFFESSTHPSKGESPAFNITFHTISLLKTMESIMNKKSVDPQDIALCLSSLKDELRENNVGASTYLALNRLRRGVSWEKAGDYGPMAAGCGACLRIVPVALWLEAQGKLDRAIILDVVRITHNNEEAMAGALVVSQALQCIIRDQINNLLPLCTKSIKKSKLFFKLKQVEELLKKRITPSEAIMFLGNSGYTPEAVSSALYAFLYFPHSFRNTILGPLLAGGESSAIAALSGAFSGAYGGEEALPIDWLEKIDKGEQIVEMATEFAEILSSFSGSADSEYPLCSQ